jgi:hypothetical protein
LVVKIGHKNWWCGFAAALAFGNGNIFQWFVQATVLITIAMLTQEAIMRPGINGRWANS